MRTTNLYRGFTVTLPHGVWRTFLREDIQAIRHIQKVARVKHVYDDLLTAAAHDAGRDRIVQGVTVYFTKPLSADRAKPIRFLVSHLFQASEFYTELIPNG